MKHSNGREIEAEREATALEETARKQLALARWDQAGIFRETAEAATCVDVPYWIILLLSGAIATLGLALDNAAVVIGAMLIAPLLAPVMGLALALAVGDVRLAVQTGATVAVSTLAVVCIAALLTGVLPFQTITTEITARTRPSTLDLVIAVCSGLAGAVVSVTGRKRLSAAIPGVAIAVALIPPLAAGGFGIGAGWQWPLIKGSMLLFGANLAGIVLSGMLIFLLIGMHRPSVVTSAMRWHREATPTGLAAWADRARWVRSLGVSHSAWVRVLLVLAFVVAVAVPLTGTLMEIARETRVNRAIHTAAEMFEIPGRSSILNLDPVLGETESQAFIRIATTAWFDEEAREVFERTASAQAHEPVHIVLEQLPASSGDLAQLARLLPARQPKAASGSPPTFSMLVTPLWERIQHTVVALPFPEAVHLAGAELRLHDAEQGLLRVGYAAERALSPDTEQILIRQLEQALAAPRLAVALTHISTTPRTLTGTSADSTHLREVATLLRRYESLHAEVIADTSTSAVRADTTVKRIVRFGVPPEQLSQGHKEEAGLYVRLYVPSGTKPSATPEE